MKTQYVLLFFIALFSSHPLSSQSCLPQGIEFSTQGQLDSFSIRYPNCTEIAGDVLISRIEPVGNTRVNLLGLSQLTKIGGSFRISTSRLKTLEGLENLESVGSDFILTSGNLVQIDALQSLTFVGGVLSLARNHALTNIRGFSRLDSIGGGLHISDGKMTDLQGLEKIKHLSGNLYINVDNLIDFNGLQGLESVTGNLTIDGDNDLSQLESVRGLDNLNRIGGRLYVDGHHKLTDLSYLSNLRHLGSIRILWSFLTDLSGLEGLTEIEGKIAIINNQHLKSFNGFHNLEKAWDIEIQGNSAIENFVGFEKLDSITADFRITSNHQLKSMDGFNVRSILGEMHIVDHNNLEDLTNLRHLSNLKGFLNITSCPSLKSFEGFENIQTLSEGLMIWNNGQLVNLKGFDQLQSVKSQIIINSNHRLKDLGGLENLRSARILYILSNDSLTNLTALENITSDSIGVLLNGQISIMLRDNPMLSVCAVEPICEALRRPDVLDEIRDNLIDCNSRQEILDQCLTTSTTEQEHSKIQRVYPNPTTGEVIVTTTQESLISIYNSLGILMTEIQVVPGDRNIDLFHYPNGIYFFQSDIGEVWKILKE